MIINNNYKLKYHNFILSISYGNYVGNIGGTNKVILAHKLMLESGGISHIHIFLCLIRIPLTDVFPFKYWGVTIDGHTLKQVFTLTEVIQILGHIINSGSKLNEIHIHHLMYLNMNHLVKLLDIFIVPIKIYLHDFYTICLQFNLLKDDNQYCGKGAVSWDKCNSCRYYLDSNKHSQKIIFFLNKYKENIKFIAPSDIVKEIWTSAYPYYKNKVIVVYHQNLLGLYRNNCEVIPDRSPVKIAFVGGQAFNKGWTSWINVTRKAYNLGCNEKFYHFGNTGNTSHYIKNVPVCFSSENINAMVMALRTYRIDVAVLWSICPETYSYTYYESTAANTFIITNINSGNIAAMVRKRNNGIVLDNESEFAELICNEKRLRHIVNHFKQSGNYGPLDLVENTEFLQLLSKGNVNTEIVLPKYNDNIIFSIKRKIVTNFYKLHQYLKEAKNA